MLVSSCGGCGHRWYFRRPACPRCGAVSVERFPTGGQGVVTAVTVVQRRTGGGEAVGIALVELDEGVRAMVRCPPDLSVGQRVGVGVKATATVADPVSCLPTVL